MIEPATMDTLFSYPLTHDLPGEDQARAAIICKAINAFICANDENPDDYPDLVSFVREDLYAEYLTEHLSNPQGAPFLSVGSDGLFIESIHLLHAFSMSAGLLSSFSHHAMDTVDNIDVVGRAIYHGAQALVSWFSGVDPDISRHKALGLLVATLPASVETLEQDMPQYGGNCSPRPELLWIAHDSLHHCVFGSLVSDDLYQGTLPERFRRQLVDLSAHDDQQYMAALDRLTRLISLKGDDQGVRQDHLQHVIALSIYNPVFRMINEQIPAKVIAELVTDRARLAVRNIAPHWQDQHATISQILYNALAISPEYLREVFGDRQQWIPEKDPNPIFAKGPVMAFAGYNASELQGSIRYFSHLYGPVVMEQLADRASHDVTMIEAMITASWGHIQALDDIFKSKVLWFNSACRAVSTIASFPGAFGLYDIKSIINLFNPLLNTDQEFRQDPQNNRAFVFQTAMRDQPMFKAHVLECLSAQDDISLADLNFTGLCTTDIPKMTHRLRERDLESILQAELGL